MTHPIIDGNKPKNKQKKKSLTPGGPTQLARNMPQADHTLLGGLQSAGYAPGVPQAPEVKSRSNKSNPMLKLVSF